MVNLYDIDDDWLEAIYKEVVFNGSVKCKYWGGNDE